MAATKPRKGGPAPLYGKTMRKMLVTLDEASIAKARKLGAGNLSAGIRAALGKIRG